jgi:hypothetical protein
MSGVALKRGPDTVEQQERGAGRLLCYTPRSRQAYARMLGLAEGTSITSAAHFFFSCAHVTRCTKDQQDRTGLRLPGFERNVIEQRSGNQRDRRPDNFCSIRTAIRARQDHPFELKL